jgi:dTDP-4-dehydrorhamnose 3,5-epimerase-like enzyme
MTLNIVVPYGRVKFVFYDEKKNFFHQIIIGENSYKKITVKPKVWFGFKGIHSPRSLILNCANLRHSKKEILRKKVNAIKYDWSN